jgi:UDP-N-acetylmuramyl pentapeptide synthase
MKNFILKTLQWILKCLAQAVVWRYRPGIIGVTGSVGKTSTKFAIASVLGGERNVRVSPDSHNNELGFPLAILGEWRNDELELVSKLNPPGTKRVQKIFFWLKVIFAGVWQVISFHKKKYPEILVLEYGADRPGDLKYLLMIARPNVSVITAIGDIPVHVEFYAGPDEIAREKARIIERLPAAGFAILNHDDESVMNLKDRTRAHVITFGFAKGADLRIANFGNVVKGDRPIGISFKLEYGGSSVPVRLEGAFGRAQAYAATAASAIGLIFGMNLITISEALRNYKPSAGRMQVLPGAKDSWLIDDAYNASPASMHAALDTLKSLPAKRKVAVLGDML